LLSEERLMLIRFSDTEFEKMKELLIIYEWGQRSLITKLNIIHEDHINFKYTNPIEYITGRMKAPASIAEKLHRLGLAVTVDSAVKNLYDMAGVRIICPFGKDIYYLVDILREMPECKVLVEKDYISNPKPSGYRSYHVIMEVPIYYSGKTRRVPVEVQIRTEAMNFWSTLEHRARYKFQNQVPKHICDELVACAEKIAELDNRLYVVNEVISTIDQVARHPEKDME
jgi:putative GTP pyrophosphokinase